MLYFKFLNRVIHLQIMIYHIYWGTSGNSGLYLDEIYQVLNKHKYTQKAFVNYYYPFEYGEKLFFKRGDVGMSKYNGVMRNLFQLQEILCGYIKILLMSNRDTPVLINYSHVGQSYCFIIWFLLLLKKFSGAKLMVTCHDVKPHTERIGEMENRKKIFDCADYLLVHTNNSIKELREVFNIDVAKILKHPFPIMDLSKLTVDRTPIVKETDFLFIGHLRKDKGIEFLLDAWKDFYVINKNATLRVCGRKLAETQFDETELSNYNVEFNLRFIKDEEYCYYVRSARYVLLPYLQGTNSGIISTVLSLGTDVITSDLPMFREIPLVTQDNMFVSGDKESLVIKLQEKWQQKNANKSNLLKEYRRNFERDVIKVYRSLM